MNAPSPRPSPYRLRLEHEGLLSLRLEHQGRRIRFDPREPPADGELVVLTWAWPEHLEATARAFAEGRRPVVVAPEPVLAWLVARGAPRASLREPPATVDGISVSCRPYTPIPWATPAEAVLKARSALLRPDRALRRLHRRRGLPTSAPQVVELGLPDGGRLVHLNLSLHSGTPAAWLDEIAGQVAGADWLLLGCDYGEQEAVRRILPRLQVGKVLLVDLLGEVRRSIGMPTELLTPLGDQLADDGVEAYVFASRVSYRFEH